MLWILYGFPKCINAEQNVKRVKSPLHHLQIHQLVFSGLAIALQVKKYWLWTFHYEYSD